MRVLVFGASGQVGRELCKTAPERAEVTAFDEGQLDIRESDRLARMLRESEPAVVINCAAFTNVDGAESAPADAMAINGFAPGTIAEACVEVGARLIHLSTDYVFDGAASAPYTLDATPNPLNVYGATKLEGERRVLQSRCNAVVVRTAWVHSASGANFVKTAVRALTSASRMRVVDDQIGTPTRARHLASALWRIADRQNVSGVQHFTDAGVASWYDVAVAVEETLAVERCVPDGAGVDPISTRDRPSAARRPAYSVLDKHASWTTIGYVPPHWRVGVEASVRELIHA
jgi:dTDP-4-dehydrorhamnose reductase